MYFVIGSDDFGVLFVFIAWSLNFSYVFSSKEED